jgi:hypothetical protein
MNILFCKTWVFAYNTVSKVHCVFVYTSRLFEQSLCNIFQRFFSFLSISRHLITKVITLQGESETNTGKHASTAMFGLK